MRKKKRLVAWVLCLCLLCGMPISVSAAEPTQKSEELCLIGAQPIVQTLGNKDWNDRMLLLYFNQAITWGEVATVRLVLVDGEGNIVKDSANKAIYWKTGGAATTNFGVNGYMVRLFSTEVTYQGQNVLSWNSIANMLANDTALKGKGYRLQVRIYEKNTFKSGNGTVDSVKASADASVWLKADATDSQIDQLGFAAGTREYARMDIGTVDAGAAVIRPMGVVRLERAQMNNETDMTLTFSEAVTVDVARTEAVMQVVDASGAVVKASAVTLTGNGSRYVSGKLTEATWAQMKACQQEEAGRAMRIRLTESKQNAADAEFANSYTVDSIRGVESGMPLRSYPYATDTAKKDRADYTEAVVEEPQNAFRLVGGAILTEAMMPVDMAKQSAYRDKTVMLSFTSAIADTVGEDMVGKASVRLVVVDDTDAVVVCEGHELLWRAAVDGTTAWGLSGARIRLTSSVTVAGSEIDTLSELVSLLADHADLAGKNYRIQVRIYENNGTSAVNGLIDCVRAADGSNMVLAGNTKADGNGHLGTNAAYDCTTLDLGYVLSGADAMTATGVVALTGVQMTSDRDLVLTFSESVVVSTENLQATLQLVDGTGREVDSLAVALRSHEEGALHAYGRLHGSYAELLAKATDDKYRTVLTITESGTSQKYDMVINPIIGTASARPLLADTGKEGNFDSLSVSVMPVDTAGYVTLDKAETITIQDREYIKMIFSEPIVADFEAIEIGIIGIDGNGRRSDAEWPLSELRFYGPTGQILIGKVDTYAGISNYGDMKAYVADKLGNAVSLALSVREKDPQEDLAVGGITSADGTKSLFSTRPDSTGDAVDAAVDQTDTEALHVENIEIYSDKYLIVTFSQPVTKLGSDYLYSAVRLVYSDNNMAQTNQWKLNFRPYGLTEHKLVATLPDGAEWSVLKGKETADLTLKICFEEIVKDSTCRGATLTVDAVYASGEDDVLARNYLIANKPGKRVTSYDGAYFDIANPNPIEGMTDVTVVDGNTLQFTFPIGVVIDGYGGTAAQAVIGFADEQFNMHSTQVWLSDTRPLHKYSWYGTLTPVEESLDAANGGYKIWQATQFYNTYRNERQDLVSLYDLMAAVWDEDSIHYGKILVAGVEQSGSDGDIKGYVDNVTSHDGKRILRANSDSDGAYMKVVREDLADTQVSLTPIKAVKHEILNETQMKITFSEEMTGTVEFAGIRMTDSTGHMVCNNWTSPFLGDGKYYQWGGTFVPCEGNADDEWILTLTWSNARDMDGNKISIDFSTMYALWEKEFKAKGYELNFAIESKAGMMQRDGLINDFTNAQGRHLLASREPFASPTQSVWNDCLHLSISDGPFFVTDGFAGTYNPYIASVEQHGVNQVLVTFSQAVVIRNEQISKPYIGLRLVSDADLGVAYYNKTTGEMTTNSRRCDANGNKMYLNELTGEETTEKICKDANGNIQYDENGNEKTNKALNNTVQQWNAVEWVMIDPTQMLVTFDKNLDVAALVNEENLPEYMAKDYSIRFCIEETDNRDGSLFIESNRLIHNITSTTNRQLLGNKIQSGYDGILMPVDLIDPNAPITITDVEITGEVELTVTFSEAIDLTKHQAQNGKKYAYLCYVDPATGRTHHTEEDGTVRWQGQIAYADELQTKIKWTMQSKNPANTNLQQTGLAEVFEVVKNKESLKGLDGVFRFCMEETWNGVQGFVDSFFGLTGKIIEASPYIPRAMDGVYADVDTTQVIAGALSIVSAKAVADNELLVTFSAPIAIEHDPFFCIRLFNADNAMLWMDADGKYTTAAVDKDGKNNTAGQWSINWEFANDEHTQIRCKVNGAKKLDCRNVSEIFAFDWSTVAEGGHFRFYVEELGDPMVLRNCHVDNIALASDSRIHLDATDFNSRDGAGIVITQEYTPMTLTSSVSVINESQLRISFSHRVEIQGSPYMAIGYVGEDYTLLTYRDRGINYAQWDGKWEWENDSHTSIIWTKTTNTHGCRTIGDIVNKIGLLKWLYPNAKVMFRIEDTTTGKFGHTRWNELVDNVSTANGTIHLSANAPGGNDRCWIGLKNTEMLMGESLELLSVRAIDNMRLELTFSEAVTVKQGDEAPTMAIRYLTKSGDSEVGVDGRTISFVGDWEYKDDEQKVIVWTLNAQKAQLRGASSLDDILTFANTLKWNKGARIAFVIFDNKDYAFSPATMRIRGISARNGYRSLVATVGGEEVSQLQMDIEIGYDLPVNTETTEEIVYITNYLPYAIPSAALIVVSVGVAVILWIRHKKRKGADQ